MRSIDSIPLTGEHRFQSSVRVKEAEEASEEPSQKRQVRKQYGREFLGGLTYELKRLIELIEVIVGK